MPKRPTSRLIPIAVGTAALAAAITGYFVFGKSGGRWEGPQGGGAAGITRAELKRDYQNGILTLDVTYKNNTGSPVRLEPPFARLVAAGDKPVFLYTIDAHSRPEPVIPPGEKKSIRLRFWLEPEHFFGTLTFVAGEDRIPIKSDSTVDIQTIENQKSVTLTSPDWNPKKLQP